MRTPSCWGSSSQICRCLAIVSSQSTSFRMYSQSCVKGTFAIDMYSNTWRHLKSKTISSKWQQKSFLGRNNSKKKLSTFKLRLYKKRFNWLKRTCGTLPVIKIECTLMLTNMRTNLNRRFMTAATSYGCHISKCGLSLGLSDLRNVSCRPNLTKNYKRNKLWWANGKENLQAGQRVMVTW